MRDIWSTFEKWQKEGKSIALATVVSVSGSSLRPTASKMLMNSTGEIYGSVSGGCVEGAVFDEARKVISDGSPRLVSYGVSDEAAWEVGLSCGGSIKIFIESMSSDEWKAVSTRVSDCIEKKRLATLATIISGPGIGNKILLFPDGTVKGSQVNADQIEKIRSAIPSNWTANDPSTFTIPSPQGESVVFIEYLLPPPRLIIIGAVHIAIPLVTLAKALDFYTIIVDPRSAFSTRDRFPHADELVREWPDEALQNLHLDASTCVVCLSHDEKLDVPALKIALNSQARYIGALGSKVTQNNRLEALRAEGVEEAKLSLIHSPVGLKLGGKQPAEIALSIMAEIIATQHGYA
jgi:xanthine dehydrogenase accessory factor